VRLAQKISEAYIKGHQGNDLKNRNKTATCLKHYIGESMKNKNFELFTLILYYDIRIFVSI
jgi:beta-glucosidase-like glycosyl hydrolase